MGDVLALHDGERRCDAHAIIGTKGCAIGLEPVSVAHYLDGIGIEIEREEELLQQIGLRKEA